MSLQPNIEGPFAASRTAPGDEPPPWPVLARLPLVGPRPAAPIERLPTYAVLEPQGDYQSAPAPGVRRAAPLRVVDAPPVEAPPLHATRVDPPQYRLQSPPVEPAGSPARGYDWPEFDERGSAAQPSAPRHEQYRVDAAEDRFQGLHSAKRRTNATLATRVARWHAALAPHAGVAITVVLILSGSLLYWFTVGRQRLATGRDELLDAPNTWSSETTASPPLGAVVRPFESYQQELSEPLTTPEAPRVAEAAPVGPQAETPRQIQPTPASDGPALSPGSHSAPPNVAAAPPVAAEPITPTPNDLPYPTTEYPWFEPNLPTTRAPQGASDADAQAPVDHPLPAAAG